MLADAQEHLAFKQRIQKEKWMPTRINDDFQQALDIGLLTQKYGKHQKTDKDTYKLSKFDMTRLLQERERSKGINFTAVEQELVNDLTPIESQSVRIWKDRSYYKNQQVYNENLLKGKCGNFAFDNELQRFNENRFQSNIDRRRNHVADNALRAREILQL